MSSSFSEYTQLTSVADFDPTRMVFGKPVENNLTLGDGKAIKFYRIHVGYRNPDETVGELVFGTERLFSYGVQENKNQADGRIDGYSIPLCLWDRDGATPSQTRWVKAFASSMERCKTHVLSVKDKIEKYDLETSDLKKFDPTYWKRDKGVIVEGKGPTLYPKLVVSKKENPPRIKTDFYWEESGESLDPLELIGKYCYIRAGVRVESIFVGNRITPQVKLHEGAIKLAQAKAKRLLSAPVREVSSLRLGDDIGDVLGTDDRGDDDDDDAGSIEEEPPKPKRRVVRKVVRKRKPPA